MLERWEDQEEPNGLRCASSGHECGDLERREPEATQFYRSETKNG